MPVRRRQFIAWGTAGIVLSSAAAGGLMLLNQDRSLIRVRRAGRIRVGYAVEPPFAFLTRDGDVTGESPETARFVAARLGIHRVDWHQTEYGALLDELEAGRFDLVAAGMFATPERRLRVTFSTPTLKVRPGLLVQKGNPLKLHSYRDVISHPSARVALLASSVEEEALLALGLPVQRIVSVPDALSGRVAVSEGGAEALALSEPTIRWMAGRQQFRKVEMAEPFHPSPASSNQGVGSTCFAFRREDQALRIAWDGELQEFIGSAAHRELLARFELTSRELPGPPAHHGLTAH